MSFRFDQDGVKPAFEQRAGDIVVYGAELIVHLRGNEVVSTWGNYLADLPPAQDPMISAQEAEAGGDEMGATVVGASRLFYFNPKLTGGPAGETRLAWRVSIAADGVGTVSFVDAIDGEILGRDATQNDAKLIRTKFGEYNQGLGLCGEENNTTTWFLTNGPTPEYPGSYPGGDAEADLAFQLSHQLYDWWQTEFDRDSYNDEGGEIEVIVHMALFQNTGSWINFCQHIQVNDGSLTPDLLGHEFTHGVIQDEGGLEYQNQSGALNESYADVFGNLFEQAIEGGNEWIFSEDTSPFRSLKNPPLFGDPDHMIASVSGDGAGLLDDGYAQCNKSAANANDCNHVHTNSGIPNKSAYLIAEGGQHAGFEIEGIGSHKLGLLYYDVLKQLGSSASFFDAAMTTINTAEAYANLQLPGQSQGAFGFTDSDACNVRNAFAATGMSWVDIFPSAAIVADTDCDGVLDLVEADDDSDGTFDAADNCPNTSNPSQSDLNGDGIGNACDPDLDGDSIAQDGDNSGVPGDNPCTGGNKKMCDDNAPNVPNPAQSDADNDSIGDVIVDDDLDGIINSQDNCPNFKNHGQENVDGDTPGDACDLDNDNDLILDDGDDTGVLGVAGDYPCIGGNKLNCDDNARLTPNNDQRDDDSDGVGDVIDNCNQYNPDQNDLDGDGTGDPCDVDKDGDGFFNVVDDCPDDFDPNQGALDFDKDGIGIACDPDDQAIIEGIKATVLSFKEQGVPVRIPIDPCIQCNDRIPQNFLVEVSLRLPFDATARIVDDAGFQITKAARGSMKALRFHAAADAFYVPPETLGGAVTTSLRSSDTRSRNPNAFVGRRYFLEIFPNEQVEIGKDYAVGLQVFSRASRELTDITPPVFTSPPADLNVQAVGRDGATVPFEIPQAIDVADPAPTVLCNKQPGSRFPLGTTKVICTARDSNGNADEVTFNVTLLSDVTPPTITDMYLVPDASQRSIREILLTASEGLDLAGAQAPINYTIVSLGADQRLRTADDAVVGVSKVTFLPMTNHIRIEPASPLKRNQFYHVTVKGSGTLTDLAGNHLDGNSDHVPGDDYTNVSASGNRFSYPDHDGDLVSLTLSGGGGMQLDRSPDGEGRRLLLFDTGFGPKPSTLTGSVRKPRGRSGNGTTTLQSIVFAAPPQGAGFQNRLSNPPFQVGGLAATVVDSLLDGRVLSRFMNLVK